MKVSAPALLPILRSDTVGDLLARTYLSPTEAITPTRLAEEVGASLPTVSREIGRMVTSGLLKEERIGRARLVHANTSSPLYGPLSELMALTYGPRPVLERLLASIDGIELAYIYGSWAARYRGAEGGTPRDVDVLVVGSPDRDTLFDAADEARKLLRREVSIRSITRRLWDRPGQDPFLKEVRSRPFVELDLTQRDPEQP